MESVILLGRGRVLWHGNARVFVSGFILITRRANLLRRSATVNDLFWRRE